MSEDGGSAGGGPRPLAVVTGASGFVGSHIVDELLRSGAQVRCLLRPRSSTRWLDGKAVEIVRVSFDSVPPLAAAVKGADWIVHAAGLTRARAEREFHECNVAMTERMLRATVDGAPGVRRFLLVSSQAAAGPSWDGRPVTEVERPDPVSRYGRSKLRAEELTMLLRDRLPVVVIRPPAVYGPRDVSILKVFTAMKWHVLPVLRERGRFTLVYAEDLARAIRLGLTEERAKGQVYFVGEPEETTYEELGDCVRQAMGTWAWTLRPPWILLQGVALANELVSLLSRQAPIVSREKIREITSGDWICSSAKIRAQLGWTPQVPLADGIRRTAAWYREAGWV